MKKVLPALFSVFISSVLCAQIYTAKQGGTNVSFYSEAPLENIEAINKGAIIVLKATTGELQIRISIQNFKFRNSLMEEHFNENYMESDKYPNCEFRGKINETVDYTQDGETRVTVTGKMELHGVIKDVTIEGNIVKTGNTLHLNSKFPMRVADYNIKVPSMYVKNIAEVVEVTFDAILEPYQKK